ncbi:MAG: undecaprenyl/decaprenyl-phosphate alpha-N-acetylglucosaminyl 1-phosphate transferase, partial [Selenomonas sp.]|nr:undecaprenyl/decaprenyl-phosphate alpha-N-acetylglucosaminyl 1-phosphate transferase [Selenomonas sp.]
MPDYVLAFIIAAGVALFVTPGVIFFAKKTGAMDAPDARKVHKRPVPRIGG